MEWGRHRNIDGIPGLMIEGEYEWWEARVRPALAFRIMYPKSCISFLCDTGHGHFDCAEKTAHYIALFIQKSMEHRLQANGTLKAVDPQEGWLADRYHSDLPGTDGDDKGKIYPVKPYAVAAPYNAYKGDPHDAFWYFDREMAEMTMARYRESQGKRKQYVGVCQDGKLLPLNSKVQCGMLAQWAPEADGITFHLQAVYTDSTHMARTDTHAANQPHIEVISGPVEKIDDNTFRITNYEAGWDNPRRSFSVLLVAVGEPDKQYRGCVQPVMLQLPHDIMDRLK